MKTCKSEGCNRKFERTSLSDLCPPCTHAFKSAQAQFQRRSENRSESISRATSGRADILAGHRGVPAAPAPAHDLNPSRAPPAIDIDKLFTTYDSIGGENSAMKDMFGMLLNLSLRSGETEEMKIHLKSNTQRICRLEAKLGNPDDLAVPLSLAVRNLPLPAQGVTDLQLILAAFKEINAPNVDLDRDITTVVRHGATADNLGTVFVEMSSDQARASIMKTKKVLESHHNPGIRKLIIKNMKQRSELKMDIALNEILKRIPGSENCFIANNGQIREKAPNQRNTHFNQNPNPNHFPYHQAYPAYPTLNQNQRPPPQSLPMPVTRAPVLPFLPRLPPVSAPAVIPFQFPAPVARFSVPPPSLAPPTTPVFQFTASQTSGASFDSLVSSGGAAPVMYPGSAPVQGDPAQEAGQVNPVLNAAPASEAVIGQSAQEADPTAASLAEMSSQQ